MDKLVKAGFDAAYGVRLVNNREFYISLAGRFIDELVISLYTIEDLTACGDYEELIRIFHTIKGSSAMVGHDGIREKSQELEMMIKTGNIENLEEKTEQYIKYCSEIIDLVRC